MDGKYVTSVPIVNPEDEAEEAGNDADGLFIFFSCLFTFWSIFFLLIFSGNLRPSHRQPPRGLRDLKSATNNPADDLMKRYNKKFTIFENQVLYFTHYLWLSTYLIKLTIFFEFLGYKREPPVVTAKQPLRVVFSIVCQPMTMQQVLSPTDPGLFTFCQLFVYILM